MEILVIINKILDLKIVQWGLLTLLVILLAGQVWFGIKYNGLRLNNAILKSDNANINAALVVQNEAIRKSGEEFKQREEGIKQAGVRSQKVAIEAQANLKRVLDIQWEGSCNEKVQTIFAVISSNRRR